MTKELDTTFIQIVHPVCSNSHYEIFYNISNSCEFLSIVDNFVFRRISLKFSFF